jgi:phosphoribosylformimino-5-aminoimidazole carboxamide ribotide isomerase
LPDKKIKRGLKMIIIPAIDLINGKCVRLVEGDFKQKTEYSNDPVKIANDFKNAGAKRIHIVDLDGAKSGVSINRKVIKNIKKETGLIIETGGGIRKEDDIKELIDAGIDYAILGTILVENLPLVEKWLDKYKNKLIAGIDARDNIVKTKGWLEGEGLNAIEFGRRIKKAGFTSAVFTDISKDGKLKGANIKGTKEFAINTGLDVILSGGISNIEDVKNGAKLDKSGVIGIIIGKAYYEGKINLKEVVDKYQK